MITKPVVLVEWIDSVTHGDGWKRVEDLDLQPSPCISAGMVIDETEESITVAGTVDLWSGHYATIGAITIPKVAIIKRHELGEVQFK